MHKFIRVSAILSLTLLSCLLAATDAFAQGVKVSGKVMDANGEPLIAVTVFEDGKTTNGTMTDIDGNYSLTVSSAKSTIVFSCLGFTEVKEVAGGRNVINVTLKEESLSIDAAEVVSVGYGTVSRRDLTGSVSKVDMGELMKAPVTNFDQALTGKVAGVVVTTSDGALGTEANITIRGNNSLTQSSAPLYIIDGFPTESSMATALSSADIESIDILKDASATAIYGARGANGVVVITTKQGVEGKPKVNFSASWTMNQIANKVELMDGYEFVCLQTEIYGQSGNTNAYLKPSDEDAADGTTSYSVEDYKKVPYNDWQDALYRTSLTQNYSISLSGGSKEAGNRYNVSFSAIDQDGIIINSNFQRYQGKVNFQQKIGKKFTVDVLANYSHAVTNGVTPTDAQAASSATGWLMYSVWGYRPVKPIRSGNSDDLFDDLVDAETTGANDYRFNPVKTAMNEYRKTIVDYLNANVGITWEIIENLKLKVTGGYTMNKRRREEFNGTQTYTGYPGSPSGKGINGAIYWHDKITWLNENTLTWTKHIKRNHHLQLLGGFTMQGETFNYKGTVATQMTTESLGLNGLNTGKYQSVKPWQYDWTMMSGLFRLNYNYRYKYYLTASFRADGSSKFPDGNRWGYFPSAGASWNFNREDWLKDKKWLSNGKLRASWGLTGNNRTTTPYDYYSQISTLPGDQNSFDYVFGGQHVIGFFPSNMANDKLKWETTEQWNVGLDLSFFESRIKLTADWYLKNTRDLLLQATIPSSSGYTSTMMNIGSMQNQGAEFTLDLVPVQKKNFQWNINFNIAFNRNKVTALTNDQYSLLSKVSWDQRFNAQYAYITQVGKPSGLMYGYIYEGTYKADDFNSGTSLKDGIPYLTSVGKSAVRPGDPKYRDINGDGIVDDNDRTVIGCGQPLHTGGFSTGFNFYGFDVNIAFSWSYGNDILNANRLFFENGNVTNTNQWKTYTGRWTESNPDSDIPRVGANGIFAYSSRVVEDGSFLRLRNISVGYTLPRKVLRKMHFDTMRVYVSADNIFCLTNYSGPDPEVSTRNSVLTPGFDWSAYPRAFGLTAGLSFTF
ncbi:MAG: TonB-dependent receptor [Bacteroidales bacterium]|nr:TonB-dependent receptor [Bacteroidales bacterium]